MDPDLTNKVNTFLAMREAVTNNQKRLGRKAPRAIRLLEKRRLELDAIASKHERFAAHNPASAPALHCLALADFIRDAINQE